MFWTLAGKICEAQEKGNTYRHHQEEFHHFSLSLWLESYGSLIRQDVRK